MLNRLNGWQRIGVVLTGAWLAFVFFVGALGYANLQEGRSLFVATVKGTPPRCTAPAAPLKPGQKSFTFEEAHGCAPGTLVEGTPDRHRFMWELLAAAATIPALLGWLAVYAVIAVIRWIGQGFGKAT